MITNTSELEPTAEHADDDGYVRAYNVERGIWEDRLWFEFHENQGNWPHWAPKRKRHGPPLYEGLPLVILVAHGDHGGRWYKTRCFLELEHATDKDLQLIGMVYNAARGDTLHIERVSEKLYTHFPAEWLRP